MLVVNPNATSTTAAARDVIAGALASRLSLRVEHTDHRGHAAELAHRAVADGVGVVVVHGGDGTVNEVVNGLLGPACPSPDRGRTLPAVAVVPGGSANVFARSLGLSPDPLAATQQLLDAADRADAGAALRVIGLGGADDRWFLFNAGLGWDAEVVHAVEQRRNRGKAATPGRYFRAAVRKYVRSLRRDARLTVSLPGEDDVPGVHMAFVSASDPWTYLADRPVRTNPGTTFDTGLGLFGVTSLGAPTIGRIVAQMLATGGDPHARHLLRREDLAQLRVRCASPTSLQLDGEHLGERDEVHFYRVPRALRVLAPPARTPEPPRRASG